MLSRNPELHFVFARMGMAEEQGFGIGSLRDRAKKLGLPLPRYMWDAPYLVLKLYRSTEAAAKSLDQDILKSLSKSEQKGWQWLATQGRTSSSHYADIMKLEPRTARRHLNRFEELVLVRKTGSGPSIEYEVI
jgi:ATP-dependent DNA helicase RecG